MLLACALTLTTSGGVVPPSHGVLTVRSVEIGALAVRPEVRGISCAVHEPDPVVTADALQFELRGALETDRSLALSDEADFLLVAHYEAWVESAAKGRDAIDCCAGGCVDLFVSLGCFAGCWHPYWRERNRRITARGWDGFHNLGADEERATLVLKIVEARTGTVLWKGEAKATSAHVSVLRDLVARALYTLPE